MAQLARLATPGEFGPFSIAGLSPRLAWRLSRSMTSSPPNGYHSGLIGTTKSKSARPYDLPPTFTDGIISAERH